MGKISPIGEAKRTVFFEQNLQDIRRLVHRAVVELERSPDDTAVIVIDADDPEWADLADFLLPGTDWQQIRDTGQIPVARGIVPREVIDYIGLRAPDLANLLKTSPPNNHLWVIVAAAGGVSVRLAPYSQEEAENHQFFCIGGFLVLSTG